MSKRNIPPIHAFNDVFFSPLVLGKDIVVLNFQGEEVDPLEHKDDLTLGVYKMFKGNFKNFSTKCKKVTRNVDQYVPRKNFGHMKTLNTEEYEKLSPSFQDKYEKVYGKDSITYTDVEQEVIFHEQDFDAEIYLGEKFFNEVHEIANKVRLKETKLNSYYGYREDRKTIVGFENFLPHNLNQNTLFTLLENIYESFNEASEDNPLSTNISIRGSMVTRSHSIWISFYENPYKGERKNVKLTKKNGRPYADGRSVSKPDYPSSVSRIIVDDEDVMSWWNSVGGNNFSDEKKLEILTEFLLHLRAGAQ